MKRVLLTTAVVAALAGCALARPLSGRVSPPLRPASPPGPTAAAIPASASFISASVGWVWGPASRGSMRGRLLATDDGGRTWREVRTPPLRYGAAGHAALGVRFADPRHGFLFGGELLRTGDGGRRWSLLPAPGPVAGLATGAGGAYALARRCPGCEIAHLYRVGADGLTRLAPSARVDAWWALAARGRSVYLLTLDRAEVHPILWASEDGGRTWRRRRAPCAWAGALGGSLALWSSQGLVLACGGQPGAGNQAKRFYTSADGGSHWRPAGRIPFSTGYVAGIAAADRATWVLAQARDPQLEVTHDGGHSWQAVSVTGAGTAGSEGWGAVAFASRRHAVAVPWTLNGDALALSGDGGRSWRAVSPRAPGSRPARRSAADPWTRYWTAVDPGRRSQSLGPEREVALSREPRNELDQHLSAGNPLGTDLAWPSPRVLVSGDGGRHWGRALAARDGFWGLDFSGRRYGWAVGVTRLYRTDDGGRRWSPAGEPRGHPLVRVAFAGPSRGFGLTTAGRLVQSRDGGASWSASSWPRRAEAVCQLPAAALVADRRGGLWRASLGSRRWERVAADLRMPAQYAGWWVDVTCAGARAIEQAQAFCQAACGGGVERIVRQSHDGGRRWRTLERWPGRAADAAAPTAAPVATSPPANASAARGRHAAAP